MLSNGPWHYRIGDETHGSLDLPRLRAALADGDEIMVREEGSQAWCRPDEVPGLLDPFAGPADPDWPNSPTKVFLYLAAAIIAAKLGALGSIVAIAVAHAALTSRGRSRAEALPLACVYGLAVGFALSYAKAPLAPMETQPAWYAVIVDCLVPIGLATAFVLRDSIAALLALLALQAVSVALYAIVAAMRWQDGLAVQIAAHGVALVGLARLARDRARRDRDWSSSDKEERRPHAGDIQ